MSLLYGFVCLIGDMNKQQEAFRKRKPPLPLSDELEPV